MPLYEYECSACGHRFEQIQRFSDPPIEVCPNCGEKKVQKLLSSPAIQFKGSGWYITDYARKGGGATTDSASKPASGGDDSKSSSSDSGTSSSKSEKSTSADSKPATPTSKQS